MGNTEEMLRRIDELRSDVDALTEGRRIVEEHRVEDGGLKVETKWGTISGKRTAEFITIVLAIGVAVLGYAFYVHAQTSDTNEKRLVDVLEKFQSSQEEHTKAIRMQTCVFAHAGDDRKAQFMDANSLCKQMAK